LGSPYPERFAFFDPPSLPRVALRWPEGKQGEGGWSRTKSAASFRSREIAQPGCFRNSTVMHQLCISAIALGELPFGAEKSQRRAQNLEAFEAFEAFVSPLEV
jgi:hypothetical protein